jgi:hypothetical protein
MGVLFLVTWCTAIRKDRDENGSRADVFGSNAHSNGDLFSGLHCFSLILGLLKL